MRLLTSFFLIALACTAVSGLQAGTISFASLGTAADPNQYQTYGASIAIAQHPNWANPLPGSTWVSYGATGDPASPGYFMPANGTVVSFYQALSIPMAPNAGTVTFRADDSAALYVNDALVIAEANNQNNTYALCSDFPVGCLVRTEVTADITPYLNGGGINVLRFDVAQRGSYSFGLDYSGSVSWVDTPHSETPEPTTFMLIGAGFAMLGMAGRKSR